jgi:multidrug efflux pump subunit AcrB
VFYNEFGQRESASYGQLVVQLEPAQAKRVNAVTSRLREQTALIPGARVRVKSLRNGPPLDAPVAIRLVGDELTLLRQAAAAVEQLIRETPGTINIENPIGFDKVDLRIDINRDKAAMLGVPLNEIDRVVRASLVGLPLADYRDEYGEDYAIVARLAGSERPSVEDFRRITVAARDGMPVPLEHLATPRLHTEFDRFMHRNLRRAAMVTGDVLPGHEVTAVATRSVVNRRRATSLLPGFFRP